MNKKIYEVADQLIAKGIEKAEEIGVNMVLAVVDDGGNLVAFRRMEDSFLVSIDVAQGKAFSGAALRMPTSVLAKAVQPGAEIYGMEMARPGKIITFGGGYPLFSDGELIGGFGMSGGSAEEDMICAEYAIKNTEGVSIEK